MNVKDLSPRAVEIFEGLIKRYPKGFSISPSGDIYEVVLASPHISKIIDEYALPPQGGGYFVAKETK